MNSLYILRSKNANAIMGTGSVTFGFKRVEDARVIVQKVRDIGQNVKVWYTAIKPDKFVLTTAPVRHDMKLVNYNTFDVVTVDGKEFLNEMLGCNLSVRIINDIKIENNFYTLYSELGYEPYYSRDDLVIMLERHIML